VASTTLRAQAPTPPVQIRSTPVPNGAPSIIPASDRANFACHKYLAYPVGGDLYFEGESVNYFVRWSPESLKKTKFIQPNTNSTLVQVDLTSMHVTPRVAMTVNGLPLFVPHGLRLRGFSLFNVKSHGGTVYCFYGDGQAVSVSLPVGSATSSKALGDGQAVKSLAEGRYLSVAANDGTRFADLVRWVIKDIDLSTFQQRIAVKFNESLWPLYVDGAKSRLFAFDQNATLLRRYVMGRDKSDQELRLAPNERLLQSYGQFAVLGIDPSSHSLEIREMRNWSEVGADQTFKIPVEQQFKLDDVGAFVNLQKQVVILLGGSNAGRRATKKILIYHYPTKRLIGSLDVPGGSYATEAVIDPNGKVAVVVLKNRQTELHMGLRVFRLIEKTWHDIKLD